MDRLAVLIPCYNEEKTVGKVVTDWKKALPDAVIYVYDNNSTDETVQCAEKAGAIVRYEHKQGKGNVVRKMFREIDADCYVLVDGDDTYPAESGSLLTKEILFQGRDMVVGDRLSTTYYKENKRRFHGTGNTLVRFFINHLFKSDIKDVMSGLRAFSFEFVKTFPVISEGFEIETEMTIHALDKNLDVKSVGIEYRDRPEGSTSKLNTVKDGIKVLKTIIRLYADYRPRRFFTWIALLISIVSGIMFIPVFCDYLDTGLVERFPTLIVCGFMIVAALLSLFSGIILQTLVNRNRRDFEFKMQEASRWKQSCNESKIEK